MDPREWVPVWRMSPSERLDYAELRASLEVLGCAFPVLAALKMTDGEGER